MDNAEELKDSNSKIQEIQAEVNQVVDIMRLNVDKVIERDQKLSELEDRADALHVGASHFQKEAKRVKRNMWLKNMKMYLIMGGIGAVLLLIIIVWISSQFGEGDNKPK